MATKNYTIVEMRTRYAGYSLDACLSILERYSQRYGFNNNTRVLAEVVNQKRLDLETIKND